MDILNMFNVALMCVSLNVYHEARNEPIEGQYAVAFVTMNRAKERQQEPCEVVFKRKQFSWTNEAFNKDGGLKKSYVPRTGKKWDTAKKVALAVLLKQKKDFTKNATYFYADYIEAPNWSANKEVVGKWGVHIFLRTPKITKHSRKAAWITLAEASEFHYIQLEKVSALMSVTYSDPVRKRIQSLCMQSSLQNIGLAMPGCFQQIPASYSPTYPPQKRDSNLSFEFLYLQDQFRFAARHPVLVSLLEDYSVHHHLLI
jgi:N-acetylmuramoyl-L-alanine amidase